MSWFHSSIVGRRGITSDGPARRRRQLGCESLDQRLLLSTTPPVVNEITELHAVDSMGNLDLTKGDQFGSGVASAGDIAVVGALHDDDQGRDAGAAYVFRRDVDGDWDPVTKLFASVSKRQDEFGHSVAIDGSDIDGYTIAIAAPGSDVVGNNRGAVHVFTSSDGLTWSEQTTLTTSDGAGSLGAQNNGNTLSISGNTIVAGNVEADAAYVFQDNSLGQNWSDPLAVSQTKLTRSGEGFGEGVSIVGDTVAIGARTTSAAAVYVFERISPGNWTQTAKLTRSDGGQVGSAVSVSDNEDVIVGGHVWSAFSWGKDVTGGWQDQAATEALPIWDGLSGRFGGQHDISGNTLVVIGPNGAYVYQRIDTVSTGVPCAPTGGGDFWCTDVKLQRSDGERGGDLATDGTSVLQGSKFDDATDTGTPVADAGSVYVYPLVPLTPKPGISVSPTSGLVTTEGGGSDTFTVVLDSQPTADVTIDISSSNLDEGTVDKTSLTFKPADWNVPETVAVTGVDDGVEDGDTPYNVVTAAATSADLGYSGLDASDVSVTNLDDDGSQGGENVIYVWDVSFESRQRGRNNTDWRVVVDVRHDSDFDATAEDLDDPMTGVEVTVIFTTADGTIHNLTGTTDANGVFRSNWIKNLGSGDHHIEVTDLVLADFAWDPDDVLDPTIVEEILSL